jgi:hypothetical protein
MLELRSQAAAFRLVISLPLLANFEHPHRLLAFVSPCNAHASPNRPAFLRRTGSVNLFAWLLPLLHGAEG